MEVNTELIKQENFDWKPDLNEIKVEPSKCGEIHTLDYLNYTLVCSICGECLPGLFEFGTHYREKHVALEQKIEATLPAVSGNTEGSAGLDIAMLEYSVKEEYLSEDEECFATNNDEGPTATNASVSHQDISHEELSHTMAESTGNKNSLEEHSNSQDKEGPYACPHCPKVYYQKENRREHIDLVHNKKRTEKCPKCRESFLTNESHTCGINSQNSLYHNRKLIPIRLRSGKKSFQHEITSQSNLAIPVNQDKRPSYSWGEAFYITYYREKPPICAASGCRQTSETMGELKAHHKTVHMCSIPMEYKCDICNEKYKDSDTLSAHKKTHVTKVYGGAKKKSKTQ